MTFRAMIDQGSESCFISRKAARLLDAPRKTVNVTVQGIGAVETERVRTSADLMVRGRYGDSPPVYVTALVMSQLTNHSPQQGLDIKMFGHLANLELADNDPTGDRPIKIILGAEVFSSILRSGVRIGQENEPIAQETSLGWISSGRVGSSDQRIENDKAVSSLNVTCVESLDQCLRSFWEIEEVPSASLLSLDEEKCEEIFQKTTIRRDDGRYQVRIPFKTDAPDLGDTRRMASGCYRKLEARLNQKLSVAIQYHEFLNEYLELGHMSLDTTLAGDTDSRCFLPHHPVIRESSTTTKLRVVFNASARSQNGKSLNDCMHVGPKLHHELFDIILRWRMFRYVCSADIEKMFRQILIAPEDTAYQCIFWKPPNADKMNVYRLNTVTYGTAAAPYLSMRVLQQLAEDESRRFPHALPILRRDTYVDDVLFGADTVDQCRLIRDELIQLLRAGGFPLRKWESNSEDLLTDLPTDLRARDPEETFKNLSTKVLGIHWRQQNDQFSSQVMTRSNTRTTKRAVLSIIASIFDPLGWVSPTVVTAKIFLQKLWRSKIDWDTELPQELIKEWSEFHADLINLTKISIPRWTGTLIADRQWELHGFADASTLAYAAAVYIKCQTKDGPRVTLLTSKTRVAPVKEMTVPRLELSAAVLLSKLFAHVQRTLGIGDISCFCWSDSSIVLAWLRSCPSKLKRFIANRVWQIREKLPKTEWRHVPTDSNPADLASRGVSATDLACCKLWWAGPLWLYGPLESWPTLSVVDPDESLLELRARSLTASLESETDPVERLACRFSSWPKLLRFTALVKRSVARFRKPEQVPSLSLFVQEASEFWIRHVQSTLFAEEIKHLKGKKSLPKGKLLSLDAFIDKNGVLRAGGRLKNAELPFAVLHPIILGSHHITTLIIKITHLGTLHGGPQLMSRVLREKYWIIRARNQIKSCVNRCVICVRHRATPLAQKMGDLPAERVTSSRAFERVGIDYAGPFQVRALPGRGRAARKGYVALFVCLATRAIHSEFVSDYTSPCFLAAFRRFVSRYGLPALVMSDNGTTFQGAERELRDAFAQIRKDQTLANWFATERVDWLFIPPVAPHFGGIWEAGVKSTKHHLRRVINNQLLTFEEMITLLAQISACLNSRPIAPLSDTVGDFSYLTPGHFLSGGLIMSVPEPTLENENLNHLARWKRVQHMRDQFWRTWRSDYLLQLQQRSKWQTASDNLKVGDVVLMRSDGLPPCKWELGRVIECFPGKDGLVRVVKVKTAKSMFNRAVTKLCLLPLRSADSVEKIE